MGRTARTLLSFFLSSNLFSSSPFYSTTGCSVAKLSTQSRVLRGFRHFSTDAASTTTTDAEEAAQSTRDSIILERLRMRRVQGAAKTPQTKTPPTSTSAGTAERKGEDGSKRETGLAEVVSGFQELGLGEEVKGVVEEMGITVPTEIQCIGIPAVLEGKSVVLGSHIGSGRTLAYMLPLAQLLRRNEKTLMKPRSPRAVVLCPTWELTEQVFCLAKSVSNYAKLRPVMVGDGDHSRNIEDSVEAPIDMAVGTPGGVLQHIEEGNTFCSEVKYLVLDEADTMFDCGLGPEICNFVGLLKNRTSKSGNPGFQAILVTSLMTKMLGERLSPLLEHLERDHAGQVAGMLLEMDPAEVIHLIESPDALKDKVAEAMDTLRPAAS